LKEQVIPLCCSINTNVKLFENLADIEWFGMALGHWMLNSVKFLICKWKISLYICFLNSCSS